MRYAEITESAVPAISPQQASDAKMYGPLYHGTREDLTAIIASGFDAKRSIPVSINGRGLPNETSNGYSLAAYGYTGIAAPVHHLGFGIYLTTVKTIAKKYSGGTTKGQRSFYLDSQRILTINFGAANTMMRWWQNHGYDMTAQQTKDRDIEAWITATQHLTDRLSQNYDAVHFLGKAMRKLLDGDQVCVYDSSLLRVVDPKLAGELEIGAKVVHTQLIPTRHSNVAVRDAHIGVGWHGLYNTQLDNPSPFHVIPPPGMLGIIERIREAPNGAKYYDVKWRKGGVQHNYEKSELHPYIDTSHRNNLA